MGNSNQPIVLSFFSGAMGIDLGLEKAGFQISLACEVDNFCQQTITINKPNVSLVSDIRNYSAQEIKEAAGLRWIDDIDLIVGIPPCQAFSTAGRRKGFDDERGNVFIKYLELCLELQPKYFVIENVRGLLSSPLKHRPHDQRGEDYPPLQEDELKGGALNFILYRLNRSGYGYSFNLYNAANFGTPQIRERVIIICARNGSIPPYLMPTHAEKGDFNLPAWKTLKTAIADLKHHDYLPFPEKRLRYYRLLKPGENWRNLPDNLQREALGKSYYAGGGKTGFFRRLAWDKPSPTLVTHPAMPATDLAHPTEDRPLSVQEYKRIQEFPDDWQFAGPLIQQYKQIGNAVPISLGFAVGCLIRQLLEGKTIEPIPSNFRFSRYRNTRDMEWKIAFEQNRKQCIQNHGVHQLALF